MALPVPGQTELQLEHQGSARGRHHHQVTPVTWLHHIGLIQSPQTTFHISLIQYADPPYQHLVLIEHRFFLAKTCPTNCTNLVYFHLLVLNCVTAQNPQNPPSSDKRFQFDKKEEKIILHVYYIGPMKE